MVFLGENREIFEILVKARLFCPATTSGFFALTVQFDLCILFSLAFDCFYGMFGKSSCN